MTIHSTPNATANATLQVIGAALAGDLRRVHGQVKVARDVLEIDGVCGLPVALDRDGRRPGDLSMPSAGARAAVVRSAESIDGFVRDARGGRPAPATGRFVLPTSCRPRPTAADPSGVSEPFDPSGAAPAQGDRSARAVPS